MFIAQCEDAIKEGIHAIFIPGTETDKQLGPNGMGTRQGLEVLENTVNAILDKIQEKNREVSQEDNLLESNLDLGM